MCTLHVVIFCQDNIEWYNSCSKENINRHNFFYDCAYRTVHSKCSVWNAVTFDILNQISCLRCHSAAFVLLFLMIIKSQHKTRFQKNLEVPILYLLLQLCLLHTVANLKILHMSYSMYCLNLNLILGLKSYVKLSVGYTH